MAMTAPSSSELAASSPHAPASSMAVILLSGALLRNDPAAARQAASVR